MPTRVAVLFFFIATSLQAALPFPREKEKWLKLSSGEFAIYSNASARETERMARDLLHMREAIGKVTRLNVRSPLPVYVYVFRDERSFAPYRDALFEQRNVNFTGGFFPGRDAKFIILQADSPAGIDRVVYHELAHHFVDNTISGLPVWFSEGIAEYYSTFSAGNDSVNIGKAVTEHVRWLREGRFMPLSQLLAIDHSSPDYHEEYRQGVLYAQSWALVHYLFIGNAERLKQLPVFLSLLDTGKPVDEAFRTAFAATYEELERELRQYVARPTMQYVRYSLTELKIPEVPKPQPIARDEVLYALGNLLARASAATVADGEAFAEEAIRVNPNHAEAHGTLGYVRANMGKLAESHAAYEKAVALGSFDPQVYISYASSILHSDEKKARHLFERATQLDPTSARAWSGLGQAYLRSDQHHAEAIAALEKSLSLGAAQPDVILNLIQLYALTGRADDAQRQIDLLARTEPALLRQARQAMAYAQMNRAHDLLSGGKRDEALALLHRALEGTTDQHLRTQIQRTIHMETLNGAITRANAGKIKEALKILDELIPQITDRELKADAEKLRADFARRRK